ncbi:hypothetical protein [Amycolatopsis keratiniphila]|uniref:hypothetical protein n=1 Tax=Amycolatopsis keratiniphila TaxID=129921 RepID=UPI00117EEAA1|nr:hypothetical protein [Amycolatopsis keratiniphila]
MREIRREVTAVAGTKALVWIGETLHHVSPDSTLFGEYCETFDTVAISPRRDLIALMTDIGTTGLLLSPDGRPIRELTRSGYKADAYRYPLVLCTLPDGRTGLIHCPDEYNRLEVEVAATGERLTGGSEREPSDFFHSRLAVSPDGKYLLSAGWVWHPWYSLAVYDLERALADPTTLDSVGDVFNQIGLIQAEVSGACFVGEDIVISTSTEENDPDGPDDLGPTMLARWSLADRSFAWRSQLDQPAGDVVPFAGDFLALYDHPRLYDGATGDLIAAWPDLPTGHAEGPIVWDRFFSGPRRVAVDEIRRRFAVTDGERTTIVHLG